MFPSCYCLSVDVSETLRTLCETTRDCRSFSSLLNAATRRLISLLRACLTARIAAISALRSTLHPRSDVGYSRLWRLVQHQKVIFALRYSQTLTINVYVNKFVCEKVIKITCLSCLLPLILPLLSVFAVPPPTGLQ